MSSYGLTQPFRTRGGACRVGPNFAVTSHRETKLEAGTSAVTTSTRASGGSDGGCSDRRTPQGWFRASAVERSASGRDARGGSCRRIESLGEGVGTWRSNGCSDDPVPFGTEDLVEARCELCITTPHQEPDWAATIASTMVSLLACWRLESFSNS